MSNTKIAQVFRDLDISFQAHPVTGNPKMLVNEASIEQAIRNIVLRNKFESVFEPTFYTDVTGSLFEMVTAGTQVYLKTAIQYALKYYETRVDVLAVNVVADGDQHTINVSVTYKIINQLNPVTVNFFLSRVR
jgi:phage baseplate assembly protein W